MKKQEICMTTLQPQQGVHNVIPTNLSEYKFCTRKIKDTTANRFDQQIAPVLTVQIKC